MDLNWVAIIVAVLGAGGIGAAIREIASVISLARKGVSGREDKRRLDIIEQRDHALALKERAEELQAEAEAGEAAANDRADRERQARIRYQEELAKHRRAIILDYGGNPGPWPDIDETTDPGRGTS